MFKISGGRGEVGTRHPHHDAVGVFDLAPPVPEISPFECLKGVAKVWFPICVERVCRALSNKPSNDPKAPPVPEISLSHPIKIDARGWLTVSFKRVPRALFHQTRNKLRSTSHSGDSVVSLHGPR